MSGHSKWSTIKHKKAINDAKKGKIFSKLSQLITHAARNGGGDIEMNPTLRMYVIQAKEEGFPLENIQKAIDKGDGKNSGPALQEASYEGYAPGGVAMIIDVLTDNSNRTVAEIRNIFNDHGGRMGETGSVSWNFDTVGYILVKAGKMVKSDKYGEEDKFIPSVLEDVMMEVMDIDGVIDITEGEGILEVIVDFKDLARVRDRITDLGYVVSKAHIWKSPKMPKEISEEDLEKAQRFLEAMEDNDDVQNIWTEVEGLVSLN